MQNISFEATICHNTDSNAIVGVTIGKPRLILLYSPAGFEILPNEKITPENMCDVPEKLPMLVYFPYGVSEIWIKFDPKTMAPPIVSTVEPEKGIDSCPCFHHVYSHSDGIYSSVWLPFGQPNEKCCCPESKADNKFITS